MIQQEKRGWYDTLIRTTRANEVVNPMNRAKILHWFYRVVDQLNIPRSVVEYAVFYLDSFLCSSSSFSSNGDGMEMDLQVMQTKSFRLASLTALHLALKIHSCAGKKFSVNTFVRLGNNEFSSSELHNMELMMLQVMKFRLNPPTIGGFVIGILQLEPVLISLEKYGVERQVHNIAHYLAELSLLQLDVNGQYRNSIVAIASVLLALKGLLPEDVLTFLAKKILVIMDMTSSETIREISSARSKLSVSFLSNIHEEVPVPMDISDEQIQRCSVR